MLWTQPYPEQARRKSPQPGMAIKQTQWQRKRFEVDLAEKRGLNHPFVGLHLESLRPLCRGESAHLNNFESAVDERLFAQAVRTNVRGSHGVLDREIDSDAADGRHRVG